LVIGRLAIIDVMQYNNIETNNKGERMLNKSQILEVITHSIETQKKIKARVETDPKAIEFSNWQFSYFKSLYKTAFQMYNQAGVTVDGVKLLDESEVEIVYNLLPA
jgi:hypothetical protein